MELAHLSMYISSDEQRAEKWLSHANPKQASPWDLRTMIRSTSRAFGIAEDEMMREYDEIYRDMNLAKHGNPMALASSTIEQRDEVIYVVAGPHSSVSGRRLAHTAILNAVRYTYLASMKYILDHVAQPERASIGSAWHPISRKWT
jgi:hypothetical protein